MFALKKISKEFNFVVESLGSIDWFVDAIVAYQFLHYGPQVSQYSLFSEDQKHDALDKLQKFNFSTDSKKINKTFFQKIGEQKLDKIFSYLYEFIKGKHNHTDITECQVIPDDIDLFTYSFPCQDLSTQGKQKGLKKNTRSGLIYQIERILKNNKTRLPKVLLMENVPNFAGKKFISYLEDWIKKLKKLGYKSSYKILSSADFGSPQVRKRLFLVSWLNGKKNFSWPEPISKSKKLKDVIDFDNNDFEKYERFNGFEKTEFRTTENGICKANLINYSNFSSENHIYLPNGRGPTLTASGANSRIKIFFPDKNKIRPLNELECAEYMGFDKEKIKELRDQKFFGTQRLIFLLGNSIPVELLESVFKAIVSKLLS